MTTAVDCGAIAAPGRHGLVSVSAAHWPQVAGTAMLSGSLDRDTAALVAEWGHRGWPVITRRVTRTDKAGSLPVGLPLPPSAGKRRVALGIFPDIPWQAHPPVTLAAARSRAPTSWQASIVVVLATAEQLGLVPYVYGALLWETLTGLPYLHAGSDLDLLWPGVDAARLPALLAGLTAAERIGPLRLDGEILCAAGGVNWRELAAGDDPHRTVLVKGVGEVRLAPVQHLFTQA